MLRKKLPPMASTDPFLPPVIRGPTIDHAHTHTVIMLHGGRYVEGADFAAAVLDVEQPKFIKRFPTFRWVFPSSHRGLQPGSPWFEPNDLDYDLGAEDGDKKRKEQYDGLRLSIRHILDIIEEEVELLDGRTQNIILGGYLEGMATALWTMLIASGRSELGDNRRFGAFIGITGWLPFEEELEKIAEQYISDDKEYRGTALPHRYIPYYCKPKSSGIDKDKFPPTIIASVMQYLARTISFTEPSTAALEQAGHMRATPVLFCHDTMSQEVSTMHSGMAAELLQQLGFDVQFEEELDEGLPGTYGAHLKGLMEMSQYFVKRGWKKLDKKRSWQEV
ncbi:hypothetical protein FQN57_006353 [Myotisia sp. PD_48]|nr:hypothetical protein FQN57_006353 [Myotisia sp. PD_48]